MRKFDEIALYAYMRDEAELDSTANTDRAAAALGINPKRAHSLVEKWRARWWCEGVSTRNIYFYRDAPAALKVWGVVR